MEIKYLDLWKLKIKHYVLIKILLKYNFYIKTKNDLYPKACEIMMELRSWDA